MAEHQPKRARQSENVRNSDDQQQDGNNGTPDEAIEPKTITNIYYDCLERIFDFLDLEDLLNVAGTCKRLQVAAAAKFGDDFGGKTVNMYVGDGGFGDERILLELNHIHVIGLKFCLPFLRCFGAKISNLRMTRLVGGSIDHLGDYVNQYCADTLLSIECDDELSIQNFPKPFKNVETVVVNEYFNHLPHFVDLFPKLRHLEISYEHSPHFVKLFPQLRLDQNSCFTLSFPNLEHLKMCGSWCLSNGNPCDLLRANRQLKSVSICLFSFDVDVTTEYVLNELKENTSISKLELCVKYTPFEEVNIIRLAREHPLLAELKLGTIAADQAMMFIRHLESMKRLEFILTDRFQFDRLVDQLDPKWQHSTTTGFREQLFVVLTC